MFYKTLFFILFNAYLAPVSIAQSVTVDIEDMVVGIIGNSNRSHIAIGTPNQVVDNTARVHCKKIRKIIIGQNSTIQLSLPNNASTLCQENPQ
jgi:hypothetical protein